MVVLLFLKRNSDGAIWNYKDQTKRTSIPDVPSLLCACRLCFGYQCICRAPRVCVTAFRCVWLYTSLPVGRQPVRKTTSVENATNNYFARRKETLTN